MPDNIIKAFGAHGHMTTQQALSEASRCAWKDVVIVGYTPDGKFQLASSHMSNKDVLWLCKELELRCTADAIANHLTTVLKDV